MRKAAPRYAHKPLLALRQGALASPLSLKARRGVLPYLQKMGLQEGEVGDDDVEEPELGCQLRTGLPPRLFTQ